MWKKISRMNSKMTDILSETLFQHQWYNDEQSLLKYMMYIGVGTVMPVTIARPMSALKLENLFGNSKVSCNCCNCMKA